MNPVRLNLKRSISAGVGLLCATGVAMAHNSAKAPATAPGGVPQYSTVVLAGEIIDPQCFFIHESRGLDHVACATKCARGGQGLAFLDERSGTIFPLLARQHYANQNELVLPHIGKRVQVKGTLYRRGANAALQVQSVAVLPGVVK